MVADDPDIAIKVEGLNKSFKLPHQKHSSLKSVFLSSFQRKRYEMQHTLRDINFDVKRGEFFGVVGRNGSGKSTLLKLVAGIYAPDKGSVTVNGSLTPFIELGVGFNPELTGRENVYLNGSLLGLSRKDIDGMYGDIVEFAELKRFMDQKLKNYSSGMQVRLAFSISIRAHSDILMLDEVLAVGDALFQQKCFDYFHELKKGKKTVMLVSHDINAIRQYCTKGILLENGEMVSQGPIEEVVTAYLDIVNEKEKENLKLTQKIPGRTIKRRGNGKVLIQKTQTKNKKHKTTKLFTDADKEIVIEASYKARQDVEAPVFGVVIKNSSGNLVFSTNNIRHEFKTDDMKKGDQRMAAWQLPNMFNTGQYYISPAVADTWGKEIYDWIDDMATFKVRKKSSSSALIDPEHTMSVKNPGKA